MAILAKTLIVQMPTTVAPVVINVQITPSRMRKQQDVLQVYANISVQEILRT